MNPPRLHPDDIRRLLREAEGHLGRQDFAQAEAACRAVLATAPNNPLATHYLGAVAFAVEKYDPAVQLLKRATELAPQVPAYFASLAEAQAKLGRFDEALIAIERAAALKPDEVNYLYHLGALAGKLGRVEQSLAALRRVIQLKDFPGAHNDLGLTLSSARRLDEALQSFRRAIAIDPDYHTAFDNLIYFMHFQAGIDGMTIRAEAEAWARRFAEPLTSQIQPHASDRDPNRRLRIGFVSPDLYEHPVGRFMQSILSHHDREAFEITCYSDCGVPDAMSAALRGACEHWVDTAGASHEALAQKIRDDSIDILVDLSLHMGENRLRVFARKPAPVQATYLGYAGTSGMSAMDWRISDPHLDPAGNDPFYTERTLRLPRSYWCYSKPPFAAALGDVLQRDRSTPITFACLNNIVKISDAALNAWAQILREVPGSIMIIQGEPGEHLLAMGRVFEQAGVDVSRIEFAPRRSLIDYFRMYQRVDIALDAFPYAGGTTTCDALWMGVPVVTLAGQIAVHRGGASILNNLGLAELVTTSVDQYIQVAAGLARDRERLAELRGGLRRRMETSIVMNPHEFVRDLEAAFRQMWQTVST